MPNHGGDPAKFERLFERPPDGWLDLSTGINPHPYPAGKQDPADWGALPTENDLNRLCAAAAEYYGVNNASLVVPAPGTQSLIQTLPRLRHQSRVNIVSPTYNEHSHCWKQSGHTIIEINEPSEANTNDDVIIVVNPNNPDGRNHDPRYLKDLAEKQAAKGGWLVVDEAFCDVTPDLSLAGEIGTPGLIVLRSFGKFFGLAGLRLGFALTNQTLSRQLSNFQGPWAVSTPAIKTGIQALNDKSWTQNTRRELQKSANRLDDLLNQVGLEIIGGTSLFRLISTNKAEELFNHLAQLGILVRHFSYNTNWIRMGLPGLDQDWVKLEDALSKFSCS